MKRKITWIIILAILVVMALTCPNKEAHQEKLSHTLTNVATNEMGEAKNGFEQGMQMIGSMMASKFINSYVDAQLEVKNYYIFSLGKMKIDGEDKTVSVGLFNQVFTASEDGIKEKLKEKFAE
ncbi:MAG: DUF4359 domain-containing protein [Bacteroidales bacterium]|nr:DUF4359 domain-containing protein [Bacteroidales bacterium]